MKLFKKAVLIIHGYAGGVYDQEYLFFNLEVKRKYDVFQFTLPGHDGEFKGHLTHDMWIESAKEKVEFLINNGYKSIYLIGHSMGGVIATYLASIYPEVKKLVLVSPAFRVSGMEDGKLSLSSAILAPGRILSQYGFKIVAKRAVKLPSNCLIEFFKVMNKYQSTPENINIPTLLIWGTTDTVVPETAIDHVYDNVNTNYKKIIKLDGISHDVFRENKKKQATNYIIKFLNNKKNIKFMPDLVSNDDK